LARHAQRLSDALPGNAAVAKSLDVLLENRSHSFDRRLCRSKRAQEVAIGERDPAWKRWRRFACNYPCAEVYTGVADIDSRAADELVHDFLIFAAE